jgi:hypothetical protein
MMKRALALFVIIGLSYYYFNSKKEVHHDEPEVTQTKKRIKKLRIPAAKKEIKQEPVQATFKNNLVIAKPKQLQKKEPFEDAIVLEEKTFPEDARGHVRKEYLLETNFKYKKVKKIEKWHGGSKLKTSFFVAEHILVKVEEENVPALMNVIQKHGLHILQAKRNHLYLVSLVSDDISALEETLKLVRADLRQLAIVSPDTIVSL